MKRKITVGVALVASAALMLTACGGGNKGPAANSAPTQGADANKLIDLNPQPVSNLKQGGTLTLPVGQVGPDFNMNDNGGLSNDNIAAQTPMNVVSRTGCWIEQPDGTTVLNKDFCTAFTSEVKDGQQTLNITINPKAVWNDGTPIDYKTFQNSWKVLSGQNKDYDLVSTDYWDKITSVERGANDKEVVVKTSTPTFPYNTFFTPLIHPAINTPDIFNKGFVGNLHPEWMAGPYKLEKYDSAAKTITEVPNEKWWGDKPLLDKITFRQLEPQATIAAFKNGEIDVAGGASQTSYAALQGTKDSEIRRGTDTFVGGMLINPKSDDLKDPQVRKAVFAAVNREELRKVRYNGLNYTQPNPGSMMLMNFQKDYQDNWPIPADEQGSDGAKKILQEAGYAPGKDGLMEKNGATIKAKVANFGDDPVTTGYAKTMVKQLRDGGIDASVDQKALSDFADVVGKMQYDIATSGYGMNGTTVNIAQFFSTKSEFGAGNKELDDRIDKLSSIEDDETRNKEAMNIERDFEKQYFVYGTIMNRPAITFVKKGLANYGPILFGEPRDWTKVGWQK